MVAVEPVLNFACGGFMPVLFAMQNSHQTQGSYVLWWLNMISSCFQIKVSPCIKKIVFCLAISISFLFSFQYFFFFCWHFMSYIWFRVFLVIFKYYYKEACISNYKNVNNNVGLVCTQELNNQSQLVSL